MSPFIVVLLVLNTVPSVQPSIRRIWSIGSGGSSTWSALYVAVYCCPSCSQHGSLCPAFHKADMEYRQWGQFHMEHSLCRRLLLSFLFSTRFPLSSLP